MYHIFLESLCDIQLNGGDVSHHDDHQEDQKDQESPPRTWMFLINTNTHHIFLETSGQILNGGDYHPDKHQDFQDDQDVT